MKKRLLISPKKKFESSPDELLGIMREIFESTGSLEECGEAFDVLSACFEELDNHLSAGGDLPTDWKGTR